MFVEQQEGQYNYSRGNKGKNIRTRSEMSKEAGREQTVYGHYENFVFCYK